jgi:hypothetical protein
MINTSVKNAFRWMLAAWMLLVTSIASSTYVHSHRGGNVAHDHDKFDRLTSCSSVPAAFHKDHDGNVVLSAVDVHHHGFLTLLGVATYWPSSDQPAVPHEKVPCIGCAWMATVSAAQTIRIASKESRIDQPWPILTSFVIDGFCESRWRITSCAGAAPTSLLCDRARHERSGVQLA